MKYKLYNTKKEWNTAQDFITAALGLPIPSVMRPDDLAAGIRAYAEGVTLVSNPDHVDYGKYILEVQTEGEWKCDQFFPHGLVNIDDTWWIHSA